MKVDQGREDGQGTGQQKNQSAGLVPCEALCRKDAVARFVRHLHNRQRQGDEAGLRTSLDKIAICCRHPDAMARFHALRVLDRFIRSTRPSRLPPAALVAFSQGFSSWLHVERDFRPEYRELIQSLLFLIETMLQRRLWAETEFLLKTLSRVRNEILPSHCEMRLSLAACFASPAWERIVDAMVASFTRIKFEERQRLKKVFQHVGENAGGRLIEELFRHPEKEVRIALFEVIPRRTCVILPAILKRLASKQPWYVLRNAVLLLALLDDSGFFRLVRPFLKHPDHRVQKAVIDFIALVGGDEMRDDLIEALLVVDDRLLPGLVLLLQQHGGGEEVEAAFFSLLSDRHQIDVAVRDEVVARVCESCLLPPLEKSREILLRILEEEKYAGCSEGPIARAATKALTTLG